MPELNVRLSCRLTLGVAVAVAVAVSPQLALAQAPGALVQLAGSNACVQATNVSGGDCPNSTAEGMSGANDVAVSPDGKNVYVASGTDEAVAEFTRNADGSLTPLGCIANQMDGPFTTCTSNALGQGLLNATAIIVSPDGKNVYVAAQDNEGDGAIAEFARNADGSLTQLAGANDCIAESSSSSSCGGAAHVGTASGIVAPIALSVSPDGTTVYAVSGQDIAWFSRAGDGSLSQSGGPDQCIEDSTLTSTECGSKATGIATVTGVAVSPDGNNVYTTGSNFDNGTIAEFARNSADGSLSQLAAPNNCVENPSDTAEGCGTTAIGVSDGPGLAISPDGLNVYVASVFNAGPIAEFARGTGGALTQLAHPNDCFQEGASLGCGMTGVGIGNGSRLVVSPDGANVYAAATTGGVCDAAGRCSDVAEFARNADGTLSQLASPDSCIQEQSVGGSECPGNENGLGLGGPGIAISPDGASVYVTGSNAVAAFARTHSLTVSLTGPGSGAVSDGTGAISCPSTCSHGYSLDSAVTLTATAESGATFAGWSGACSGTGTCQLTMSSDMAVTATFTANPTPPSPGAPTPVLTSAPTAITDAGAGLAGSVDPEGLPTTVFFQYGLDKRYSQVGASGPNYTQQTPAQSVGSDFATHGVGPVAVTGLLPNALYHVRLVATNSAGMAFGQDVTFTTASAPAPGAPTLGQTENVAPVSGLVLVLTNGHLVPLTQLQQIPTNATIDSRHGTFELVTSTGGGPAHDAAAKGKGGKTQSGQFGGAVVRVHQTTRGANRGLATVMMIESAFKGAPSQAICNAPAGDAHAARVSSKVIQLLHASAHGKFTTSGRYSAATVRGTVWSMTARCDGTLTRDITDSVVVTDFIRHKTIVLHAGQSYLAPGPRKR